MKTLELESGFEVMITRKDYDFLLKLKESKATKFTRSKMSPRASHLADRLVQNQLLNRDDEFYYLLPFYETRNTTMKMTESKRRSLKVINETLRREHDFELKLDESISKKALTKIKEDVTKELKRVSYAESPQTNPEYSQCILVLEGVDILLGQKEDIKPESKSDASKVFEQIEELEKMLESIKGTPKKDDVVDYLGHKAKVINVDGDDAYIKVEGQSGNMGVSVSQLKPWKDAQKSGKASIKKGDKVIYNKKDAEVVNVDGEDAYIKVKGQSGSMAVHTKDLSLKESANRSKKISMIESKISELRSQVYMESKESEIRMMLKEDAQRAELIMAAKGLLDTVQGFQTKIGDLMNKNLDPFIERVRGVYGSETADKVYSNLDDSLSTLLGQVKDSKETFTGVVAMLSGDEDANLESNIGDDEEEALPDLESDDELPDLGDESSDDDSDDFDIDLDLDDLSDSEENFTRKKE